MKRSIQKRKRCLQMKVNIALALFILYFRKKMKNILNFGLCFFICHPSKAQSNYDIEHLSVSDGQQKEIFLLRENCNFSSFSFCSDGYHQKYRLYPLLIDYDSSDFFHGYGKNVYVPISPSINEDLKALGFIFKDGEELNVFLDSVCTTSKVLKFRDRYLTRRVRSYFRQNSIDKHFDGSLYFNLLKVKITYIPVGKDSIVIPKIGKKGKSIVVRKVSNVNLVLDIDIIK